MVIKDNVRKFLVYTFLWTWLLLFIPIVLDLGYESMVTKLLFYTAGISPSAVGIILARRQRDPAYWKDFWNRVFNLKLISFRWLFVIVSIVPLASAAALFLYDWITKTTPALDRLHAFMKSPVQLFVFACYMLLFGPVAEELGWRGFALDHLEKNHSFLASSLILGFFWAVWHLPMFFIKGTYQYGLLHRSFLLFLDFHIAIFAMSVIMDWVYNHNGRSILSGVLIHFFINFTGELLELPDAVLYLRTTFQVLIAIAILICYKKERASYTPKAVS